MCGSRSPDHCQPRGLPAATVRYGGAEHDWLRNLSERAGRQAPADPVLNAVVKSPPARHPRGRSPPTPLGKRPPGKATRKVTTHHALGRSQGATGVRGQASLSRLQAGNLSCLWLSRLGLFPDTTLMRLSGPFGRAEDSGRGGKGLGCGLGPKG